MLKNFRLGPATRAIHRYDPWKRCWLCHESDLNHTDLACDPQLHAICAFDFLLTIHVKGFLYCFVHCRYFLNPAAVSKHLYCSVCQEVFLEPHRAPCGHSFCKRVTRNVFLPSHVKHNMFLIFDFETNYFIIIIYILNWNLFPAHPLNNKQSYFVSFSSVYSNGWKTTRVVLSTARKYWRVISIWTSYCRILLATSRLEITFTSWTASSCYADDAWKLLVVLFISSDFTLGYWILPVVWFSGDNQSWLRKLQSWI